MQDKMLIPVLLLIAIAVVGPVIATKLPKLRFPTAVLEILLGMALGKSGLQLIMLNPLLHHLSELGLLYLMFLAGTEVNLRGSSSSKGGSPVIAVVSFALTLLVSALCAWVMNGGQIDLSMWMMALLLTTSSVGIIVPVIREHGLLSSAFGQTILLAALLADVVTLVLISMAITSSAAGPGGWLPLLALAGWGGCLFIASKLLLNWLYEVRNKLPSSQIGIRAALSLLGATLFITYHLHIELILGAFTAGVLLSLLASGDHHVLHEKLEGIGYGFLFPLFFISLGMGFDVSQIKTPAAGLLVPLLLACAYFVKMIGALPFRLRFSGHQTVQAGILLSTRFTLVIAVSAACVKLGFIRPVVEEAMIVVAICTVLISPLLFAHWQNRIRA